MAYKAYMNKNGDVNIYDQDRANRMVENTASVKSMNKEIDEYGKKIAQLRKQLKNADETSRKEILNNIKIEEELRSATEQKLSQEKITLAERYKGLLAKQQEDLYKKASYDEKMLMDEKMANAAKEFAEQSKNMKEREEALKRAEAIEKKSEDRKRALETYQTKSLIGRMQLENKRREEEIAAFKKQAQEDYINARESGDYEGAKKAAREEFNAGLAENLNNVATKITDGLSELGDKFDQYIDDAMDIATDYKAFIDARLQGSEKNFTKINDTLNKRLTASPFVKTTEVLKSIKELADQGIVYNLEQRAFLGSISEQIAATFDANNETLLRLIRLQQADSTAARMGIEAALIKAFNSTFSDSHYMNNIYDTVSAAILDANSQLDRDQSAAFEYIVQKWLGSLYSVGLSDAAVSTIAGGINALATGDVEKLSGNSQLTTLFAMAASRAGLPYGQLLIGGLQAENTNELLKAMVEYLKEISTTNNQVVKAAYGNVLNMNLSDFAALANLGPGDITNIYSSTMSYSQAISETQNQLNQLITRQTIPQMINTLMANAQYSLGSKIADNPVLYTIYKAASLLESMTGGIHLPNIGILGNFLDLTAFTVEGIIKGGVMGIGAIGTLIDAIASLGGGMGLDLGSWGASAITPRGSGFGGGGSGFAQGVSQSAIIGSGSGEDIYKSSVAGAAEDAETVGEITSSSSALQGNFTVNDLYRTMLLQESNYEPIKVTFDGITSGLDVNLKNIKSDGNTQAVLKNLLVNYGLAGLLGYSLEGSKTPKDLLSPNSVLAEQWKKSNPRGTEPPDWVKEAELQENATLQQALNEIVFGKVNVNIVGDETESGISDLYTYDFTAGNGSVI